jgi:2-methylcitrate dehydratase PrpD
MTSTQTTPRSTPASTATPSNASRRIAAFAASFDPASLSEAEQTACARSWFDTVTVALAGRREPATERARNYVAAQFGVSDGASPSHARFWGERVGTSLEAAALFNGIAGHVLDYDDVTSPMRGHPSIALWPALLALADARDLPGARLASAYTIGFEVICKLSRAMAGKHYARGWHSTSSIGTLGACAAGAHLLRLDETRTQHALGLAVAMSAGTRQNFGTDAKSFQAGQCGAAALRAVLLAENGFDASPDAIDGPFGYLALYAHGEELAPELKSLGGPGAHELVRSGIEVKQYPMCYAAHRTIDGVLALRRELSLSLASVQSVEIETSRGALVPLIHHRPVTGLQAKFSMQYAVAAALADGGVRLSSFTDAAVRRPEIMAFMPRVRAHETSEGGLEPRYAQISMRLTDGRTLRHRVETQHGAADDPLTAAELVAKGSDCLHHAQRRLDANALFDTALQMAKQPARHLLDALLEV